MVPTIFYIKGKRTKKKWQQTPRNQPQEAQDQHGPMVQWPTSVSTGQQQEKFDSQEETLLTAEEKSQFIQTKLHLWFTEKKARENFVSWTLWVWKQLCCLGKCKVMQPFLFLVSGDFILFIWLRVNAAFWYETAYHWDSLRVASCKFTFT